MADRKRASVVTLSQPPDKLSRNGNHLPASKHDAVTISQLAMQSLISACRSTLRPNNREANELLDRVESLYHKASKDFVDSEDFIARAQEAEQQVRLHPSQTFVITRDLFNDIKAYKVKKVKEEMPEEPSVPPVLCVEDVAEQEDGGESSTSSVQAPRKPSARQIEKLEALLGYHHKEIEKYENQELSLDDLESEDSTYLIMERLKRRAAKIYFRLCELTGRSRDMGGSREKKFRYSGSRFNELNLHVQKFVNKHSLEERMPDYSDIKKIVRKCNEKYKYRLNKRRLEDLSKEVFTEVGDLLSHIRKKDFCDDFAPREANRAIQTDRDDPAYCNPKLQEVLRKNKVVAEANLKQEFQKWAEKDEESQDKEKAEKDAEEAASDAAVDEDKDEDDVSGDSSSDELDELLEKTDPQELGQEVKEQSETAVPDDAASVKSEDTASTSGDSSDHVLFTVELCLNGESDIDDLSSMHSDSESEDEQITEADVIISSVTSNAEVIELNSDSD